MIRHPVQGLARWGHHHHCSGIYQQRVLQSLMCDAFWSVDFALQYLLDWSQKNEGSPLGNLVFLILFFVCLKVVEQLWRHFASELSNRCIQDSLAVYCGYLFRFQAQGPQGGSCRLSVDDGFCSDWLGHCCPRCGPNAQDLNSTLLQFWHDETIVSCGNTTLMLPP